MSNAFRNGLADAVHLTVGIGFRQAERLTLGSTLRCALRD